MKTKYVLYYVEGQTEEKLVQVLKNNLQVIRPGKVQKLNVVEQELTNARLRIISPGTMVVLIFDTDTNNTNTLSKNLNKLKTCSAVTEIVTIPQAPNLEGELVHSCDIRNIRELLDSKSNEEFKHDMIRISNLAQKLQEHHFHINHLWTNQPTAPYQSIPNLSHKIKLQE